MIHISYFFLKVCIYDPGSENYMNLPPPRASKFLVYNDLKDMA